MPLDPGTRLRFPWRAAWLTAGVVLAGAGVFAVMTWLPGAFHESSSATPASVITAATSTAATPGIGSGPSAVLGPELQAAVSPTAGCQGPGMPVLRVLQFNIRAALSGQGYVDIAQIAAEIEAVRPDLVSLNEVDTDTSRTHLDEPAYLAAATGLHAVYGPNLIYDGGPFGNAILTRYPVVDSHNLRLPGTPGLEPRGLLTVVVDVDGQKVVFASTHLSDGDGGRQSRLLQALAVAQALRALDAPAILAGDLNSGPSDVPARILRRDLLDAQVHGGTGAGDTYPQTSPSIRLDDVLYGPQLAVVPGSTQVRASASSDHRSVFTKLTLLNHDEC